MRRRIFAVSIFIVLAIFTNNALAESPVSSENIDSFDSQIFISPENVANITETIVYNFGSSVRHGIYRDIPYDYSGSNGEKYSLAVEFLGATNQDGKSVKSETSRTSGNFRIKLGDPDKTVTGKQVYTIKYKLWPVVTQKDGSGFVNLDIVGTGWQVPINRVSATLSFSGSATLGNLACFSGKQGSTSQNCFLRGGKVEAVNLQPYEGLTINGTLQPDYITGKYLEPGKSRPLTKDDYIGIAIPVLIGVVFGAFGLVKLLRTLRERGRKKHQTIIAEYEPPEGLTPAQIGHLIDDKSGTTEITSMLVHMAVKGYIKIEQTRPKRLFSKAKYSLHRVKESDEGLDLNEKSLYSAIFEDAIDNVMEVDRLDKSKMSVTTKAIYSSIEKSLRDKGYYGSFLSEPGIVAKLLDSGNMTDEGAKEWAKVEGFKLYLSVVEKDRLKFSDAPEKTPELFNRLLPYAIALGVEKQWAKQFKGIDVSPATDWYVGSYAGFSAGSLASDIGSSFATVVSSNSSVSSSGGSSGGGFGGGGGGSW